MSSSHERTFLTNLNKSLDPVKLIKVLFGVKANSLVGGSRTDVASLSDRLNVHQEVVLEILKATPHLTLFNADRSHVITK